MGKQGPCFHCGVTSTPLWRNGPPDKPVLCNACGSRWRTKGTLANYTPLHARADPDDYEDHKGMMRMKTISLKKREEKLNKRKLYYEDTDAMDGDFTPGYNLGYQKVIDEETSNRSSSGSAISNLESCSQFGSADASDLTGPEQSIVWDALVPSKKRTCVTRPKQSPVEKLTKELYTILQDQASHFSGSSEEDLLYESEAPMVSVEIGHGSVLIRHPSSMAKEEESEASSLSVNNKPCGAYEGYLNAASLLSFNDSNSANNSCFGIEKVKKLNGQFTQLNQVKRDKYNHESFQILCNHNSPLSFVDLTEIINCDVFWGCLTDGEQQYLLKYLPSTDTSAGSDGLKSMLTSTQLKDNLSAYQKLLADGVLDSSFAGVKTEDCKALKRLALTNPTKGKWVEHYNMLESNRAKENIEVCISRSGAKSSSSGTLINGKGLCENLNHLGAEGKTMMKCPKRVLLKVDYKRKEPLQNEGSCITPTPRDLFGMRASGGSIMLDSMKYEHENSDQDLLLDIPSNGSFPQAELLCPATSFASQQASASSSSTHPSQIRP